MTTTAIDGSRDQAALQVRLQTALDARAEGKTWEEAATAAGYSNRGACWNAVMAHLRSQTAGTVAELREQANGRTAAKLAFLEDVINDPDVPLEVRLRAADVHTRAEARHARLNGMDAPLQVALSAGVQAELEDALNEVESVIRGEVEAVTDEPIGDEG